MKKLLLTIAIVWHVVANAQVTITSLNQERPFNSAELCAEFSAKLVKFEEGLDILFPLEVNYTTTVKENGSLAASLQGETLSWLEDWCDEQLDEVRLGSEYVGDKLNWTFQFGSKKPKSFEFNEITSFPEVEMHPNVKVNFKFEKAVYRYFIEDALDQALDKASFKKGVEGIAELILYIDPYGKVIFLEKGHEYTTSVWFYESIIKKLKEVELPKGALLNNQPGVLKYKIDFSHASNRILQKERIELGQDFLNKKDYLAAAFQWDQVSLKSLESDSAQLYQMAVGFYLGGKFNSFFERKANEVYSKIVDVDWLENRLVIHDPAQNKYGVTFEVVPRNVKVPEGNKNYAYYISDVDRRPVFDDCKEIEGNDERFNCFNQQIRKCIIREFVYPEIARQYNLQDKVYVSFIVEKDGRIDNATIFSGRYPDLNKEALRIVCLIEDISPALIDNKPVRMAYTIPINFKLQ